MSDKTDNDLHNTLSYIAACMEAEAKRRGTGASIALDAGNGTLMGYHNGYRDAVERYAAEIRAALRSIMEAKQS